MSDYLYPILFSTAVILGMWICEKGSSDPRQARITYLVGVCTGVLGGRLWYSLQYGHFFTLAGLSYYGFGIGALAGAAVYHRWHHGHWASTDIPDAVAPAYALASALLRLGCYQAGCCFGKVCNLPWAVQYEPGSNAYQTQLAAGLIPPSAESSLPIHPTQLYEAAIALAAFGVLIWLSRTSQIRLLRYELWLGVVLSYSVYRFLFELLRGDAGGHHFGPLTFSQATSVAIFVPVLFILVSRRVKFYRGDGSLLAKRSSG